MISKQNILQVLHNTYSIKFAKQDYLGMTDIPTLNILSSKGTLCVSGDQMTFVVNNLAETLKESTKISEAKHTQDISSNFVGTRKLDTLQKLENECKEIFDSVNCLMLTLKQKLNEASAITVGVSNTYKDALDDLGLCADEAVKSMYTIMSQAEEIDKAMKPVHELSKKVKQVKIVLTALESQML